MCIALFCLLLCFFVLYVTGPIYSLIRSDPRAPTSSAVLTTMLRDRGEKNQFVDVNLQNIYRSVADPGCFIPDPDP
jgi:hypothetical protein